MEKVVPVQLAYKNEDFQIAAETQRVELDVPTSNVWDLVINIAEHLKKHMHFQEKQDKAS